jgi:Protein of unknown function (DUF3455)
VVVILGGAMHAAGQTTPHPNVPDKIKVPAGEELVLQLHATGSQIYVCQHGTDGKSAWTLKGPDAELQDAKGALVGHHFAGPAWKHNDGSEVTGRAAVRADSPDANSIPWLLVNVTGHTGEGLLSRVTTPRAVSRLPTLAIPSNTLQR